VAGPASPRVVTSRLHTADLAPSRASEARRLMDLAFHDFDDHDWEHALGGVHVLVVEDDELRAHGALVQRRMLLGERSVRVGYVEAVATHPDHQRRGHGARVMAALEALAPAYDLLALGASDSGVPLYAARGWQRWRGPTYVMTQAGLERTAEDDDGVWVLGDVDTTQRLVADWRAGDVW
jgi:aminoglycoside 2'-N-acetyltransferase I